MLWGAILKLRETRVRLIELVLALGIYFSADAMTYALRNLFPSAGAPGLALDPSDYGSVATARLAYTIAKSRGLPADTSPADGESANDCGHHLRDVFRGVCSILCLVLPFDLGAEPNMILSDGS